MTGRAGLPRASRHAVVAAALAVLACWLQPSPATAHGYRFGELAIGHVWAPPPQPGADGVPVYGPVLNRGDEPAVLVGVATPVAASARFRFAKDGAVSWPETIAFPAGRPLAMAAWREHIWLSGLRRDLEPGNSFELTLDFGRLGRTTVTVQVENAPGH